jgi:hypothetical protein
LELEYSVETVWGFESENFLCCADRAVTAPGVETVPPDELEDGRCDEEFVECLMLASVSSAKEGVAERTKPEPEEENGLRETNLSKDWVREPVRLRDFVTDSRWDEAVEGLVALVGKGTFDAAAG